MKKLCESVLLTSLHVSGSFPFYAWSSWPGKLWGNNYRIIKNETSLCGGLILQYSLGTGEPYNFISLWALKSFRTFLQVLPFRKRKEESGKSFFAGT